MFTLGLFPKNENNAWMNKLLSYTAVGPANKIGYVPSTLSKMECTARFNNLIKNVYWLRTSTQSLIGCVPRDAQMKTAVPERTVLQG